MHSHNIMLKHCAVDIVVSWISIDELVKKQSVEWYSPIGWTGEIIMILPHASVVGDLSSSLILVEVVFDILLAEA